MTDSTKAPEQGAEQTDDSQKEAPKSIKEVNAVIAAQGEQLSQVAQDVADQGSQMEVISSQLDKVLSGIAGMSARDIPTGQDRFDDARDHLDPHVGASEFNDDGVLERARVADVDAPGFADHAREMQFLNERVTIVMSQPSSEEDDRVAFVSVNGERYLMARDDRTQYTVPRFVVNALLTSKPSSFRDEEYIKRDGVRAIKMHETRSLKYPFQVVEDTQEGRAWYRKTANLA